MKVKLITIGKLSKNYLKDGELDYFNRLKHYCNFELIELKDIQNYSSLSIELIKKSEYESFIKHINENDYVILLDENGKNYKSKELADFINKKQINSTNSLVFIIGGAYGFHLEMYNKAKLLISFSSFTFSHQMIRLIFLEQLYRAYTIIKGEKYHH